MRWGGGGGSLHLLQTYTDSATVPPIPTKLCPISLFIPSILQVVKAASVKRGSALTPPLCLQFPAKCAKVPFEFRQLCRWSRPHPANSTPCTSGSTSTRWSRCPTSPSAPRRWPPRCADNAKFVWNDMVRFEIDFGGGQRLVSLNHLVDST